ncbi:MAG: fibronectin type III-like domain-contianing protein [Bacteroidales bacterium]
MADVIFGDVNPGGRLVQTWPDSIEQLPPMMDYNIRNGRTYMYFKGKPLYPFGFGLSYTSFAYSNLKLSRENFPADGELTVSVDITNTGGRDGDEVLQLYVKHLDSKFTRPLKELKAFRRITLKAGEMKTVSLSLKSADLAYWNVKAEKFVVEKDKIQLQLGCSSTDIKIEKAVDVK